MVFLFWLTEKCKSVLFEWMDSISLCAVILCILLKGLPLKVSTTLQEASTSHSMMKKWAVTLKHGREQRLHKGRSCLLRADLFYSSLTWGFSSLCNSINALSRVHHSSASSLCNFRLSFLRATMTFSEQIYTLFLYYLMFLNSTIHQLLGWKSLNLEWSKSFPPPPIPALHLLSLKI